MKLRRGMDVKVEFSDHVEGGDRAYRFVVRGKLVGITRTALTLLSWGYASGKTGKHDHNQTRFTIVRSSIHRIVRMVEDQVLFDEKNQ